MTVAFQNHVTCGECNKRIGFRLGSEPIGSIYCLDCEDVVMSREHERERDYERYRHALDR